MDHLALTASELEYRTQYCNTDQQPPHQYIEPEDMQMKDPDE